MGVLTVETNRDWDQDCPQCRDQLFLKCQDYSRYVKTFQNLLRNFDIVKTFWGTSGSKILTNWEILIKKKNKIISLSIKTETNCQDWQKISCLDWFLDLDQDFWDWKVVLRQHQDLLISIRIFSIVSTSFSKLSRSRQILSLRKIQLITCYIT